MYTDRHTSLFSTRCCFRSYIDFQQWAWPQPANQKRSEVLHLRKSSFFLLRLPEESSALSLPTSIFVFRWSSILRRSYPSAGLPPPSSGGNLLEGVFRKTSYIYPISCLYYMHESRKPTTSQTINTINVQTFNNKVTTVY